jgi:Uncharacterized protein conserved in bacteria
MQAIRSRWWLAGIGSASKRRGIAIPRHASRYQFRKFVRRLIDTITPRRPAAAVPATPLAAAPQAPRPGVPPAAKPSIEPVASVATPRVELAAATRDVAAPAPSNIQASRAQPTTPAPPSTQPSTDVARPATDTAARIARIVREADDASETPLGDWQTEGKGSVRIEQCGRALCGHVLNPSSTDNGELVLINMKPKEAALWSGKIYSHDSENTYYATIAMKGRIPSGSKPARSASFTVPATSGAGSAASPRSW